MQDNLPTAVDKFKLEMSKLLRNIHDLIMRNSKMVSIKVLLY